MTHPVDEFEGRPDLVKKRARVFILQRVIAVIAGIYIIGSLALLGINAVQGAQTRSTLLDCTEPTGQCAKDSQKQIGVVLQSLIDSNQLGDAATQRVVILAAACGEEPEIKAEPERMKRIALLEACINRQLDKERG